MSKRDEFSPDSSSDGPMSEIRAHRTLIVDPDQRSALAWAFFYQKIERGEGVKKALIWAIRNGAKLPEDREERAWIADVLEGKRNLRGPGRPKKKVRTSLHQAIVEQGIYEEYQQWLSDFERDRELTWLRAEARRLKEKHPDADVWRSRHHLGRENERRAYEMQLKALGAAPCPPRLQGSQTPRDLALSATARQYRVGWLCATGKNLTPSTVTRIVTRAKKSK